VDRLRASRRNRPARAGTGPRRTWKPPAMSPAQVVSKPHETAGDQGSPGWKRSCQRVQRREPTSSRARHPRFPRIGGFHEQRRPVTGIIVLSPGNASRLDSIRMCSISFHVCRRGGLEGLLPSPEVFIVRPELWLPAA